MPCNASTTCSIFIPRDAFTSTTSPDTAIPLTTVAAAAVLTSRVRSIQTRP